MSTNLTNFYKATTHDYDNFFNNYAENPEEKVVRKQIDKLAKELEDARAELSKLTSTRYNKDFTPSECKLLIHYSSSRSDTNLYFDLFSGSLVDINNLDKDVKIAVKEVNVKNGKFWMNVGYCFPLGATVARHYKYKINSNNDFCTTINDGECLCPILDCLSGPHYSNDNFLDCNITLRESAKEFISQMYDIPVEEVGFEGNLNSFKVCLSRNHSTEIILRTAPKDCVMLLLNKKLEKAEPVYKIVGLTKSEYKYAVEHNILRTWILVRETIDDSFSPKYANNGGMTESDFFHYTTQEWFDLIEKGKYWDEETRFNHLTTGEAEVNCLLYCLKAYSRSNKYWFRDSKFYKYYTFGKFMDYVCEEAINQGFSNLKTFLVELKDYLNMCETIDAKPTLYSSYLKQTHDITSRNYNIKLTDEQDELFESAYKNFVPYTTEDGEYSVIRPKDADAVKKEGSDLNHCVCSYLSKIIKRNCLIVFLRKTKNTNKSLVTIEIGDKAIVQARGASNRNITEDEYKAICEYAKKNKLKVRVAPRD